jgi:hypothetical protein
MGNSDCPYLCNSPAKEFLAIPSSFLNLTALVVATFEHMAKIVTRWVKK